MFSDYELPCTSPAKIPYDGIIMPGGNEHYSYLFIPGLEKSVSKDMGVSKMGIFMCNNKDFEKGSPGTLLFDENFFDSFLDFKYHMLKSTKALWQCTECGSKNIILKAWINPNIPIITHAEKKIYKGDVQCADCPSKSATIHYPKRPSNMPKPVLPVPKKKGF